MLSKAKGPAELGVVDIIVGRTGEGVHSIELQLRDGRQADPFSTVQPLVPCSIDWHSQARSRGSMSIQAGCSYITLDKLTESQS